MGSARRQVERLPTGPAGEQQPGSSKLYREKKMLSSFVRSPSAVGPKLVLIHLSKSFNNKSH
jgi:hypothetical protein